jgi:hypothetical protein
MVKPQQPELHRSGHGASDPSSTKTKVEVTGGGGESASSGPIPEDNLPGHHPDHEQDKPSGRDFVAKTHALAEEADYEPPSAEDEVLDLTQVEAGSPSLVNRAMSIAGTSVGLGMKVAGTGVKVAGGVYREVRKRLPYG